MHRTRPSPSQTSPSTELLRTLTLREVYEIATTAPLEQIDFMLEAERMNRELSRPDWPVTTAWTWAPR